MGIETLIDRRCVTSETSREILPLQPQATAGAGCTSVTCVTSHLDMSGAITCADCRHAIPAAFHAMLVGCAQGVEAGTPTGLRWKTDRHGCAAFTCMEVET